MRTMMRILMMMLLQHFDYDIYLHFSSLYTKMSLVVTTTVFTAQQRRNAPIGLDQCHYTSLHEAWSRTLCLP